MKKTWKISLMTAAVCTVVAITGCKTPKKAGEGDALAAGSESANGGSAPGIDSTAMSFDPTGSDSGKIEGLQTIIFEYDRTALTAEGRKRAQAAADWLKSNASNALQVEGHCDTRGSIEYNLSLGERRAKTVTDYMVGLGVDSKRLSTISYGKEKPMARGETDADHQKNRRANFVPIVR
jgi:peptidoglycan-associated lipoprotein